MLVDERNGNPRHLRCVLDKPAQTVRDPGDSGIAERFSLSLDVMRHAKQIITRFIAKTFASDLASRAFEALTLGQHPGVELGRKLRQCRFGARDDVIVTIS